MLGLTLPRAAEYPSEREREGERKGEKEAHADSLASGCLRVFLHEIADVRWSVGESGNYIPRASLKCFPKVEVPCSHFTPGAKLVRRWHGSHFYLTPNTDIISARAILNVCVCNWIAMEWRSYLAHLFPSAVKSPQICAKCSRMRRPPGSA